MKRFYLIGASAFLGVLLMLAFCAQAQPQPLHTPQKNTTRPVAKRPAKQPPTVRKHIMASHSNLPGVPIPATTTPTPTPVPMKPEDLKLVSLADIDPAIIIDIQFSRAENPFKYQFFKENVAYVRAATAKRIAAVQRDLKKRGYGLKIWSAYRPMPVQIKMYDIVGRNGDWVSDPYNDKSKKAHVRGVAIDCTLVDKNGKELEMPTTYLDFKNAPKMMFDYMELPAAVIRHRALLREVMVEHGMSPYSKEWWHFQDNRIMSFPAITMHEFPDLHKQMLVDEVYHLAQK